MVRPMALGAGGGNETTGLKGSAECFKTLAGEAVCWLNKPKSLYSLLLLNYLQSVASKYYILY